MFLTDNMKAAFTTKELRELLTIPGVGFETNAHEFYPRDISALPRVQKRLVEVLKKGSQSNLRDVEKQWRLSSMMSPKAIGAKRPGSSHVDFVELQQTMFAPDADPLSKNAKVVLADQVFESPASAVFRSVGYKSTALPGFDKMGILFDEQMGIIPNDAFGRILSPSKGPGDLSAGHLPGLYAVGWVKRGPTGVIASTMMDAFTTADAIAEDWKSRSPFLNTERGVDKSTGLGWDGVRDKVLAQGVVPVDWKAWKRIDEAEQARGKELKKVREKFTDVEQMKVAAGLA